MATLRIAWHDYNMGEDGFNIYRSDTPMDVSAMPSPIASVGANVGAYTDSTVVDGNIYYYRIGVIRNGEELISEEHAGVAIVVPDSIGSNVFIGGDMRAGYFGEVPSTDFITGDSLASSIGLSAGYLNNNDVSWWKFALDGEILYVPKKELRYNFSWDDINNVNAVYNDSNAPVVTINGFNFRVTLLTGAEKDPMVNNNTQGSEWNRLIYRIHSETPPNQIGNNWIEYNTEDTDISGNTAEYTLCQELSASDLSQCVFRGEYGVEYIRTFGVSTSGSNFGWRPALRLIQ